MPLYRFTKPVFWLPWLAAIIVGLCFTDLPITIFVRNAVADSHWLTEVVAQVIMRFGNGAIYIAGGGICCVIFYIAKKKRWAWLSAYLILAVIISGLACNLFKICLGRARPNEYFAHQLYGFYFWKFDNEFWSFPSGHSTTIASATTALYLIFRKLGWIFLALAIAVMACRVIVQAHYLSDVMAGGYLGFATSYWLYHFMDPVIARSVNLKKHHYYV